jgi:hypothetical protein
VFVSSPGWTPISDWGHVGWVGQTTPREFRAAFDVLKEGKPGAAAAAGAGGLLMMISSGAGGLFGSVPPLTFTPTCLIAHQVLRCSPFPIPVPTVLGRALSWVELS